MAQLLRRPPGAYNRTMKWACGAALAALTLLAAVAQADIYEWRDASGARHYTNNIMAVPSEYQAEARTMITDWERPAAAPAAPVPPSPAPPAPPAQAEMVP